MNMKQYTERLDKVREAYQEETKNLRSAWKNEEGKIFEPAIFLLSDLPYLRNKYPEMFKPVKDYYKIHNQAIGIEDEDADEEESFLDIF